MVALFKRKPKTNGSSDAGPYREEPPEAQVRRLREQVAELRSQLDGKAAEVEDGRAELRERIAELEAALDKSEEERKQFRRWWNEGNNEKRALNDTINGLKKRLASVTDGDLKKVLSFDLDDKTLVDHVLAFAEKKMSEEDRAAYSSIVAGALAGRDKNESTKHTLARAYKAFMSRPKPKPPEPEPYEYTHYPAPWLTAPYEIPGPETVHAGSQCVACWEEALPDADDTCGGVSMAEDSEELRYTCPCGMKYVADGRWSEWKTEAVV